MKTLNTTMRNLLICFFTLLTSFAWAQDMGKIRGIVTDPSGNAIAGVSVRLLGTSTGVSTDIDGNYDLAAPVSAAAVVEYTYIGYARKQVTGVNVKSKDITQLNVMLETADAHQLEQVVISASYQKESINALYAQRKNSVAIADGISTEQIKRSPDRNTSEVLKRVSGASIQDNKFVVVRGLSDRYNAAMLNNSLLPNTEVDKRAFSFDILPANLIESIMINKSATADLPADFSGGVVQVSTKDFPARTFFEASVGTSYNSQSTFKDFRSAERGNSELFGVFQKSRGIPANFPSREAFQAIPNGSNELFEASRLFTNNWGYSSKKTSLTPNFQLNYGGTKKFSNDSKFGAVLSMTYRYDQRLKTADQKAYVGESLGDVFQDEMYNFNTNMGAIANFSYAWKSNKLSFKNLYNRMLENQFTYRVGRDDSGGEFVRTGDYLLQRAILSNQLSGDHLLRKGSQLKLDWTLNYARVDRKEPGYKRMDYSKDGLASVQPGSAVAALAGNFNSAMAENSYGGGVNLQIPLTLFSTNDRLKTGYFTQYRDRNFNARIIGFIRNGNFDTDLLRQPLQQLFDPANIRPNGFVLNEITNGGDRYDASSYLNAGYAMYDTHVLEQLRVIVGARVESYQLKLQSEDNGKPVAVDTTAISFLPSLNMIYKLDNKQSFRFAVSQTVGRPEFRELAPFPFYDFNKNVNVRGNENLKQSRTTNFDLGYAFYPTAGETLSVGAFYKNFNNPIEQTLQLGTSGRSLSYANSASATVFGLEAEVRKNLSFINESLSDFVFSTNASYIKSKVKVPVTVNASGSRPLQGQSPYLVNAGLSYTSKSENSTALTILYNRVGPRIWAIGNVQDPDIYEYSRNILDFQIAQRFSKSRGEVKINYSDIINNSAYFYQKVKGSDPNAAFNKNSDNINIRERFGSTVSITLSYRFR